MTQYAGAICSWSHGVVDRHQLFSHQICGACAGDEPFYIVKDGVTEETVRCKYCPDKFADHKLRKRFWVDRDLDYTMRLECSVAGCPCNRFVVHKDDEPIPYDEWEKENEKKKMAGDIKK